MATELRGHQRIDASSLAMHKAIAEKLRAHPELLIERASDPFEQRNS